MEAEAQRGGGTCPSAARKHEHNQQSPTQVPISQVRARRRATCTHGPAQQRIKLSRDLMLRLASALGRPGESSTPEDGECEAGAQKRRQSPAASAPKRRRTGVATERAFKGRISSTTSESNECEQIVVILDQVCARHRDAATNNSHAAARQHHPQGHWGIFKSTANDDDENANRLMAASQRRAAAAAAVEAEAAEATAATKQRTDSDELNCSSARRTGRGQGRIERRRETTTADERRCCSRCHSSSSSSSSCRCCLTGCGCEINHKSQLHDARGHTGARHFRTEEIDGRAAPAGRALLFIGRQRRLADLTSAATTLVVVVVVFDCERALLALLGSEKRELDAAATCRGDRERCQQGDAPPPPTATLHGTANRSRGQGGGGDGGGGGSNNDTTTPPSRQQVASQGRRRAADGRGGVCPSAQRRQLPLNCLMRRRQKQAAAPLGGSASRRLSRAFIARARGGRSASTSTSGSRQQVQVHADARRGAHSFMAQTRVRGQEAACALDERAHCEAGPASESVQTSPPGNDQRQRRCHATTSTGRTEICKLAREKERQQQQQEREIKTTGRRPRPGAAPARRPPDHFYDHEPQATTARAATNETQATTCTSSSSSTNSPNNSNDTGKRHDLLARLANCLDYLLALFSLLLLFLLNPRRRRAEVWRPAQGDASPPATAAAVVVVAATKTVIGRARAPAAGRRRRPREGSAAPTINGGDALKDEPQSEKDKDRAAHAKQHQQPMRLLAHTQPQPQPRTCTRSSCDIKHQHQTHWQDDTTKFTLTRTNKGRPGWLAPLTAGLLALLLLLASGPRPLIQPSSAMLLVTQQMSPASSAQATATSTPTPPTTAATTTTTATTSILRASALAAASPASTTPSADELSRAVLATMSTQSSLQTGGEQRPTGSTTSGPPSLPAASAQTAAAASTRRLQAADEPADESADDELQPEGELQAPASASTARAASFAGPAGSEMAPSYGEDLDSAAATATANTAASGALAPGAGQAAAAAAGDESLAQQANGSRAAAGTEGTTTTTATKFEGVLADVTDFSRISAMLAIIFGDICGNSLVILSVVRHSKLRVTTNWFVVSLACADILVALFAMTFNVSVQITGRWVFPALVCDFWNSCDVMASTASILHLCCISIDRYYAIMRPLDYPMKITTKRVCYALAVVWISSALLSFIPIFTGIYTTSEHQLWQAQHPEQCEFVVNRVYALVSSSISFWIPCCIMVFTYYRIYKEATRQEKFIYKAQNMLPAPQPNHHSHSHSGNRAKQHRSKSMAITSLSSAGSAANKSSGASDQANKIKAFAKQTLNELSETSAPTTTARPMDDLLPTTGNSIAAAEQQPLTGSAIDLNNNNNNNNNGRPPTTTTTTGKSKMSAPASKAKLQQSFQPAAQLAQQAAAAAAASANQADQDDDRDSNSGQSTPTKRSISKMKREHKAAKTLGIIMGVFILCWLPFFSWYTPQHICGSACEHMIPASVVTLLFWIGYFNSTLNPIIYAYFNHEFRDAFKKTLQWIFCCCRDLKCLRVNRPNDNQHYNCTYRSTQEIGLVTNG